MMRQLRRKKLLLPISTLHNGPFRIPYLSDTLDQRIIADDIAQHDAAYDRIDELT